MNIVESPQLCDIFLMLRSELRESDIPHHTTIKKCVEEVLEEHLDQLRKDMKVCSFFSVIVISFNFNIWTRIQWAEFHSP